MITPSFGLTATERVLPKLALDFTTASLDSRITFTRTTGASNPATFVNSSGYVTAATNNQPRFDYDPVTLVCKGLLIEESRQNLYIYAQDFNDGSWIKSGATIGNDVAVSPDGTQNADKLIETATTATHYMYRTMTPVASTAYTFSVYAKAAGRTQFRLNAGGGFVIQATFDLSAVTATLGSGTFASITPVGNGWFRCTVSGTSTSTTAGQCQTILQTGTYAGDGTSGMFFWGAQLEAGAFATSYIPTTTTALTRNTDVAVMTGTNFSDWYNNTAGSLVTTFTPVLGNFGANRYPVAISNGTSAESFAIRMSSGAFIGYCLTGGVNQYFNNAGTAANNTQATCCMSLGTSGGIFAANATLGVAGGAATMPTVNRLALGEFTGVAQGAYTFQKIMYYPQRLTNSETRAFSKG